MAMQRWKPTASERADELQAIDAAIAAGKLHRISLAEAQAHDDAPDRQPRAHGFEPFIPRWPRKQPRA